MERFYKNVLGLESLGLGRWSLACRLGPGVVLLFDRERSAAQDEPPSHGASGSIHTALLAAAGEYDTWKERLADRDVTLIDEIALESGVRSFASGAIVQALHRNPSRQAVLATQAVQINGAKPPRSASSHRRSKATCRGTASNRSPSATCAATDETLRRSIEEEMSSGLAAWIRCVCPRCQQRLRARHLAA